MNIKDFIKELEKFPQDIEIEITDGWKAEAYHKWNFICNI